MEIKIDTTQKAIALALGVSKERYEEIVKEGLSGLSGEINTAEALKAMIARCDSVEEVAMVASAVGAVEGEESAVKLPAMFVPELQETPPDGKRTVKYTLGMRKERCDELQRFCYDWARTHNEKDSLKILAAAGALCENLNEYTFVCYSLGFISGTTKERKKNK